MSQLISSHKQPVPAGGTTSAINGLLGISLFELVYNISKKQWSTSEKEKFSQYTEILKQAKTTMLSAIDEDVKAYKINLKYNFKDQEKLKKIIDTPLKIAQTSSIILESINNIPQGKIKKTVKADYDVAVYNLKTSIKGAISIIKSNYTFFSQENKYIENIKKTVTDIENKYH